MKFKITAVFTCELALASLAIQTGANAACTNVPFAENAKIDTLARTPKVEKGEYETTAAWQERMHKLFGDEIISVASPISPNDQQFDADHQRLKISLATSIGVERLMPNAQLRDIWGVLPIGIHNWTGRSYLGQNAFGAQKQISVLHTDSLNIYWYKKPYSALDLSRTADFSLVLSAEQAKDLRDNLGLMIQGPLVAPFAASWSTHSPARFDFGMEYYTFQRGLIIKPTCAAIVDRRTGKILLTLDHSRDPIRAN